MKIEIPELKSGNIFFVKAKPNSSKSEILWNKNSSKFEVFLHRVPDNNKANEELIKLFKKEYKIRIEIVSGLKSKNKKIKVL